MSLPFLLEIGTEEIPDWMIVQGLNHLQDASQKLLDQHALGGTVHHVDATPRRLVLRANGLIEQQPDTEDVLLGPVPPTGYGYGEPMYATTQGFIRKHKLDISEVYIHETPKGRRWPAPKRRPGRRTADILPESLPRLIIEIPWPNTM